jgi:hypothetical protein
MRCLSCHYSLKNLTENRCPECGREFDPRYPNTFESGAHLSVARFVFRLAVLALSVFLVLGTLFAVVAILLNAIAKFLDQ